MANPSITHFQMHATPMAPTPSASPTLAARAQSAPATLPSPALTKAVMEIANIVNLDNKESETVAKQSQQQAAKALLELVIRPSHIPTPPLSSPTAAMKPFSPRSSPQTPTPAGATEMSLLAEIPAVVDSIEDSSNYAPSGSERPDVGSSTMATEDEEGVSRVDDDDEIGGDPSNPEFECWVMKGKHCTTGQSTLALSRKMVSDYFGRNKKETYHIEEHRWIRACRKHYQRKSYQDSWRSFKGHVVVQQLHMISAQEAGLRYKVTLKCSEEKRLQNYYSDLMTANRSWNPADPAVTAVDDDKPDNAPLAVLREIKTFVEARKSGDDGSLDTADCEQLVRNTIDMVKQDRCTRLPLFEMLPQFAAVKTPKRGVGKQTAQSPAKGKGKMAAGTKRKNVGQGGSAKRQKV